jgi:uncharacterized protein (DUF433 family)
MNSPSYPVKIKENNQNFFMQNLKRITLNPEVMGGKPCIRGMRVTVDTIVGLLASGSTKEEVLQAYPYVESEDIDEALAYTLWCSMHTRGL